MVMRGLVKLSKAVVETQAGQLRQVILGGDAATIARSFQAAAEEQFSAAMGKMQVRTCMAVYVCLSSPISMDLPVAGFYLYI